MQLAAHASAQRFIDQFVLGDAHFALERGGDDMRGIVIAVAQHKLVYEALGGRMGGELHALQLTTAAPN